jgi:hypothetical protein
LSFTQREGQKEKPLIDKRGEQAVAPLCVFGLLIPTIGFIRAARGPPRAQGTENYGQQTALGQAGEAALAQLLANPDRMTLEGIQYE